MTGNNPIHSHEPDEFFDGPYLQAAKAIRHNDQLALKSLLTGRPPAVPPIDPNHVGREGMTLLLWASSHDNLKAVNTLLENRADPNQKITNVKGETFQLLAIAAKGKSDDLFDTLLKHNADPNSRDRDEPALFSAIYADRFDRMHKLLDAGADINITNAADTPAIVVLARLNNYRAILDLLDRGAALTDPAAKDIAWYINDAPMTPAVPDYPNQQKVRQLLVKRGFPFPDKK